MNYGVTFDNLRKALYVILYGTTGDPDDFTSEEYRHIIPFANIFDNPFRTDENLTANDTEGLDKASFSTDTFVLFWIERDKSLTQDDFTVVQDTKMSRAKCISDIVLRFCGKDAEQLAKTFRHTVHRTDINPLWSYICNAERLEGATTILPRRTYYAEGSQISFDISFKLYYDELIPTGIVRLNDIDFAFKGILAVD